MNSPVVAPAQEQKILEPRRATVGPVPHVMRIAAGDAAARKAASVVPGRQRAPDGWRDGAGPAANIEHRPVAGMAHDHGGGIARDTSRRFSGNADAVLQGGLAGFGSDCQRLGVDMDDDLIAVACRAAIEVGGQGALGEQSERVGPALPPDTDPRPPGSESATALSVVSAASR